MSGLFRYNANVTPNRRTTLSSFCVSNQDVSNLDGSFGFGYRSTGGGGVPTNATGALSPTQGRSLREYDEKFQALRKENFNLKLRVYFLEEKLPATGTATEAKQNIDLKVEIEGLRKELQEKHELLMQAAQAMGLLEESAKKLRETHAAEVAELNKQNAELQDDFQNIQKRLSLEDTTSGCNDSSKDLSVNNSQYDELQTIIHRNEQEIEQLKNSLRNLDETLAERDAHIEELEQQLADVQNRQTSVEHSAELGTSTTSQHIEDNEELKRELLSHKQRLADKLCQIQDLEEQLAEKKSAHDKGLQTLQLLLIKTKEMDAEIERLRSRSGLNVSGSTTDDDLRLELEHAKAMVEQERHWRTECADVCSVLTIRLKELAGFLDSLLKHKDVLSVLAQDSHRAMRKAVDNSLDLSRSLSMSTSQGRFSLNEKSLMQMSSITEVLNDSYFAGRDLLRSDSTLAGSSVVDKLRDEIHTLRSELERVRSEAHPSPDASAQRDRSFRNLSATKPELNSDSEEQWSEPDRQVSHERIGLEPSKVNSHVRSPGNSKYKMSATSSASDELDFHSARKNASLRLQERVNDLETQLANKTKELTDAMKKLLASNADVAELTLQVERLTKELDISEDLRNASDVALRDMKDQLIKSHSESAERLMASERLLEEQKTVNSGLVSELDKLKVEIRSLAEAHSRELDEMIARESNKLQMVRDDMALQFSKDLDDRINLHNEKIMREMVPRTVYEDQIIQGEELEKRLHEVESLLEMVRNREHELHTEIEDKERTLRDVKRNLDEVTLQQSRAVLERTKFMNERDHFERVSQELKEKNDELASASSELHTKLAKLSHDNAQLHNKLVVNETQFQLTRSASQGNARYALTTFKDGPCSFSGPASGGDQSGYTSDETRQRLENSSPDLGIESDGTGRSSGTDVNTIQSPTGKLNRSISDILSEGGEEHENDFNSEETSSKALAKSSTGLVQHDCEKVDRENAELRRKLDRTRRAFERTWAQLRVSNQRKEQIEKDIRQEIYKTHSVLKNVRTNIEGANHPAEAISPLKPTTPKN